MFLVLPNTPASPARKVANQAETTWGEARRIELQLAPATLDHDKVNGVRTAAVFLKHALFKTAAPNRPDYLTKTPLIARWFIALSSTNRRPCKQSGSERHRSAQKALIWWFEQWKCLRTFYCHAPGAKSAIEIGGENMRSSHWKRPGNEVHRRVCRRKPIKIIVKQKWFLPLIRFCARSKQKRNGGWINLIEVHNTRDGGAGSLICL
jgi:hypothetical protein